MQAPPDDLRPFHRDLDDPDDCRGELCCTIKSRVGPGPTHLLRSASSPRARLVGMSSPNHDQACPQWSQEPRLGAPSKQDPSLTFCLKRLTNLAGMKTHAKEKVSTAAKAVRHQEGKAGPLAGFLPSPCTAPAFYAGAPPSDVSRPRLTACVRRTDLL
jgi:hypothetical protein